MQFDVGLHSTWKLKPTALWTQENWRRFSWLWTIIVFWKLLQEISSEFPYFPTIFHIPRSQFSCNWLWFFQQLIDISMSGGKSQVEGADVSFTVIYLKRCWLHLRARNHWVCWWMALWFPGFFLLLHFFILRRVGCRKTTREKRTIFSSRA